MPAFCQPICHWTGVQRQAFGAGCCERWAAAAAAAAAEVTSVQDKKSEPHTRLLGCLRNLTQRPGLAQRTLRSGAPALSAWNVSRRGMQPNAAAALPARHVGALSRPQGRRRARPVLCRAQDSPYEPLEKAVRLINRVIALGEKSSLETEEGPAGGAGSDAAGPPVAQKQRWVQFGAMYTSRVTVEEPLEASGAPADLRGTQPAAPAQQAGVAVGGGSATATAAAANMQRGRQLCDYLALPIEEYSLLDPKWISRCVPGWVGGWWLGNLFG